MTRVYLAAMGDANDLGTWSGIPHFFCKAGQEAGFVHAALTLRVDTVEWKAKRALWNFGQFMRARRFGGFQYSSGFLEALWRPFFPVVEGAVVINCFQLFPHSIIQSSVRKWFFIDQTLTQLFECYGLRRRVSNARAAVEAERQGYLSAEGIVVHSPWAGESVVKDYGISPSRVHVAIPGANITRDAYLTWERQQADTNRRCHSDEIRLVFVGKDWRRKGLDRLLAALQLCEGGAKKIRLRVIGCNQNEIPSRLLPPRVSIEWVGFVDKSTDESRFLKLVSECDVGCLFSRAEAGGIALREFQALGLAVFATNCGGMVDHLNTQASAVVDAGASDQQIAAVLNKAISQPDWVDHLKGVAWRDRHSVLWSETVSRCRRLMDEGIARERKVFYLSLVGDATSPKTHGGKPFHIVAAAREEGFEVIPLRLSTAEPTWRLRRIAWNIGRVLRGRRPGGFQYSESFLEALWRGTNPTPKHASLISLNQLVPKSIRTEPTLQLWFLVDQTLTQLFGTYDLAPRPGSDVVSSALRREREGYERASGVLTHSRWAAESLINDYQVPRKKVHLVPLGANLSQSDYFAWERLALARRQAESPDLRDLVLVFIGKEWKRKGLDRLLEGFQLARQRGMRARLRVVGCPQRLLPKRLQQIEGVDWLGFIDKVSEPSRFFDAVGTADIGCLLSRAEAAGIGLREYAALGLVVLGTDAGGAADQLVAGASMLVPQRASPSEIAEILQGIQNDWVTFRLMKSCAWSNRRQSLWASGVREIRQICAPTA